MKKKKKEPLSGGFHFRVTPEELHTIEMRSYLTGMTKSEYIRRALDWYKNMSLYAPDVLANMERETKNGQ